jgi:hypothetical protein
MACLAAGRNRVAGPSRRRQRDATALGSGGQQAERPTPPRAASGISPCAPILPGPRDYRRAARRPFVPQNASGGYCFFRPTPARWYMPDRCRTIVNSASVPMKDDALSIWRTSGEAIESTSCLEGSLSGPQKLRTSHGGWGKEPSGVASSEFVGQRRAQFVEARRVNRDVGRLFVPRRGLCAPRTQGSHFGNELHH